MEAEGQRLLVFSLNEEMSPNGRISGINLRELYERLYSSPVSDSERAGERLVVVSHPAPELEQPAGRFVILGQESGHAYGTVYLYAIPFKASIDTDRSLLAIGASLRIALNGRKNATIEDIDLLNELWGNDGWGCDYCEREFERYSACKQHEWEAHGR
jgi:hypothetical protein